MKPEGIASVEYHGDDWRFYAPLYRPDDEPLLAQSMRVMDFANVVNLSNEKQFRDSISSYLDIDGFLRFIAVNALIVNLDTLLAMPQNYYLHHRRINHSTLFAEERNHINGIENFWNQAKRHLRRFNGIKPESFYWYLKECEWRFNGGSHKTLLNQLKHWVKYSPH